MWLQAVKCAKILIMSYGCAFVNDSAGTDINIQPLHPCSMMLLYIDDSQGSEVCRKNNNMGEPN